MTSCLLLGFILEQFGRHASNNLLDNKRGMMLLVKGVRNVEKMS